MKICIELDEEMQEQWNTAKESLEGEFNRQNDTHVSFTDSEVFGGILAGWWTAEYSMVQMLYAWKFSDEDVERMKSRETQNSS
jgi:hypothetical protein